MNKKVYVENNVLGMDDVSLARLFVRYAEIRTSLEEVEAEIVRQVLAKKETVKVAGVTATYYHESKVHDWETVGRDYLVKEVGCKTDGEMDRELRDYITIKRTVQWREFVKDADILAPDGDKLLDGRDVPIVEVKPERVVVK